MADDKVVIGSNEGTPVKPGDLTKITSVMNTDSAADDSVATASIPRMKIKTDTASDSSETSTIDKAKIKAKLEEDKPKKKTTVKLKPLVVAETGEAVAAPPQAPTAPRIEVAPAPSPAQATAAPKIVSEDETVKIKTRPVIAGTAVPAEAGAVPAQPAAAPKKVVIAPAPMPAQATAVPKIVSEDETVKIQKPRAVIASTAVPGVKQTIKLRPSSTTPAPISEADSSAGFTPPPQAPPSLVAHPAPALAGASEAKRTIRLVPKKSDATSGGDQLSTAAKPSAPTIKLEEPQPVSAESSRSSATINLSSEEGAAAADGSVLKRTLKLKSTRPPEATTVTPRPIPPSLSPASPQMHTRPPEATTVTPRPIPPSLSPSAQLTPPAAPVPVPPPAVAAATDAEITASAAEEREIPPVMEKQVQKAVQKQEPSIIFTVAACIAFFVMAYFTWMLVGQYCSNYTDSKISVPGLSGKTK